MGLLLAQVPANSPSFLPQILIAIPAKAKPKRPIAIRMTFMGAKITNAPRAFNLIKSN
jgi:hypothetical protein